VCNMHRHGCFGRYFFFIQKKGKNVAACYSKYGSIPFPSKSCHEMGLRILLSTINNIASKNGKYIEPLVSCSIDFYVRIFFVVKESNSEALKAMTKLSNVYKCSGCEAFHLVPLGFYNKTKVSLSTVEIGTKCQICDSKFKMSGPFYTNPIHNPDFVKELIKHVEENKERFATHQRIIGKK
jgi:tRNA (guanine26-N2/guanine27-N2)-dimethyltransferase